MSVLRNRAEKGLNESRSSDRPYETNRERE